MPASSQIIYRAMNVNPVELSLGGADQAYFSITSDGTVAGTTPTSAAGDGNIFNR